MLALLVAGLLSAPVSAQSSGSEDEDSGLTYAHVTDLATLNPVCPLPGEQVVLVDPGPFVRGTRLLFGTEAALLPFGSPTVQGP